MEFVRLVAAPVFFILNAAIYFRLQLAFYVGYLLFYVY
jgi:hypothetical protein